MKNKSYIWISFIVLIFGILTIPKIIERIQNGNVVKADRLDNVNSNISADNLLTIGKAPAFKFNNQDGKQINNDAYKGKVYVLEFFFTTCPTICPKMNQSMLEIEKSFFGNPNFGIVSITINPEFDTEKVLKQHREALGVKSANWNFLTGSKDDIMQLANKGFNLYAAQNNKVSGGFEHSGLFALIDKKGNIRCRKDKFGNPTLYYDVLDKEGVKNIIRDIELLLNE